MSIPFLFLFNTISFTDIDLRILFDIIMISLFYGFVNTPGRYFLAERVGLYPKWFLYDLENGCTEEYPSA